MRRPSATVLLTAILVALAVMLGGCGQQGGDALARAACAHVNHSIRLYDDAVHSASGAEARSDVAQAYVQLRDALPLAAAATSQNGQWVALETTLSESARVEEGNLVSGLQQECAVADSPNPDEPPLPTQLPTAP